MKLQFDGQNVRLRIDESELARLLDGEAIFNTTNIGPDRCFSQALLLHDGSDLTLDAPPDRWTLHAPRAAVEAFVARLPCRDPLTFELPMAGTASLSVHFEVDVRDSMQTRGPRRRLPQNR